MREPWIIDESEVFAVTGRATIQRRRIGARESTIYMIDDLYQDPEAVRALALGSPASRAKRIVGHAPVARTVLDLDLTELCSFLHPLIEKEYGIEQHELESPRFTTNLLRTDATLSPDQVAPHSDGGGFRIAGVVYLNRGAESRGDLYRHRASRSERWVPFVSFYQNNERYSDYVSDSNDDWELLELVEMQFNRLLRYECCLFHSGFMKRDDFVDNYRVSQVLFL